MSHTAKVVYTGLAIVAIFALFYNLDGRLLWGDEAEMALLSSNILKFGVPKVTDGKNIITLPGTKPCFNNTRVQNRRLPPPGNAF